MILPLSIEEARQTTNRRVVVVGDIHGCFDSFVRILRLARLVDNNLQWIANKTADLVILGDMVDEGAESRQVIELVRSMQRQAPDQVHALLGNHELLMLRALSGDHAVLNWETAWSWVSTNETLAKYLRVIGVPRLSTDEIQTSFQRTYRETGFAQYPAKYSSTISRISTDARRNAVKLLRQLVVEDGTLSWLLNLPTGIKMNDWAFFHGGPPAGFAGDMTDLNRTVRRLIAEKVWAHDLLEPYTSSHSPISTRNWAGDEATTTEFLRHYGVGHIAFGHSPGALNGVFGRLCCRWRKVFKADSYISLGIEGYLEILDRSVWAVYTEQSLLTFSDLHPGSIGLSRVELLFDND